MIDILDFVVFKDKQEDNETYKLINEKGYQIGVFFGINDKDGFFMDDHDSSHLPGALLAKISDRWQCTVAEVYDKLRGLAWEPSSASSVQVGAQVPDTEKVSTRELEANIDKLMGRTDYK